jgi:hypothetical protein
MSAIKHIESKGKTSEIIVRLDDNRIWLNAVDFIEWSSTNIPGRFFTLRSNAPLYWKIKISRWDSREQCLYVRVIDYDTQADQQFLSQIPKKEIRKIIFDKLDWLKFEPLLIQYHKSGLAQVLQNADTNRFDAGQVTTLRSSITAEEPSGGSLKPEKNPENKISTEFWVYFSEARFRLGYVAIIKYIPELDQDVECRIKNDNILAEFDLIKPWFSKKLKTRKFKVSATILYSEGKVLDVLAYSKHIDSITPELIDAVKYQRTYGLLKPSMFSNPEKSLFTSDDIFGQFGDDENEGNIFNQSDEEILRFLLEKSKVRNRKQLEYLSGMKQSENNKLRFTLHPLFGFLFYIEGKENNHFVWELLNSHATYVWSIEKSSGNRELQFRRIENTINTVRSQGREQYKQTYRRNNRDADLVFRVIEHQDINSDFVDSFPKWKAKLNEQLI